MDFKNFPIKLVIVGNKRVGKTCITVNFIEKKFTEIYQPTIGVEFARKIDGRQVDFQIFDTVCIFNINKSGENSLGSIINSYRRKMFGILFVFDLTKTDTFEELRKQYNDISHDFVDMSLVGNKLDLIHEQFIFIQSCQVILKQPEKFAKEHNMHYYETSAKTGENLDLMFEQIAKRIIEKLNKNVIAYNCEGLNQQYQDKYHFLFKYIVIGEMGVGKSSILLKYTENRFNEKHDTTIGVEFGSQLVCIDDEIIKIQIWDICGCQSSYRSITRAYYQETIGVLLVFDLTKAETFKQIKYWYNDLVQFSGEFVDINLIGNKLDLEQDRQVTTEEAENLAKEFKMHYYETSAKTGHDLNQIFEMISKRIIEKINSKVIDPFQKKQGIKPGIKYYEQIQQQWPNQLQVKQVIYSNNSTQFTQKQDAQ